MIWHYRSIPEGFAEFGFRIYRDNQLVISVHDDEELTKQIVSALNNETITIQTLDKEGITAPSTLPYRIKPGYNGIYIELPKNAIVADIGFGGDPVRGATYYIDRDLGEAPDRNGEPAQEVPKEKLILADVSEGIPLPDKSVDFSVASHIAEHMTDPEKFCRELTRISKAGYIETPGLVQELFQNHPQHMWLVTKVRGTLYFIRKPGWLRDIRYTVPECFLKTCILHVFRYTSLQWKDEIRCTVVGGRP